MLIKTNLFQFYYLTIQNACFPDNIQKLLQINNIRIETLIDDCIA